MAAPLDMRAFVVLKAEMEQLVAQRKAMKSKMDEIQKVAVKHLLELNKRYVDESGTGAGPFWTLCKDTKEGSWRAERYHEFFTGLLGSMANGTRYSADQLVTLAQAYLKQFEKRELKIEKHSTARRTDVADLKAWLERRDEDASAVAGGGR